MRTKYHRIKIFSRVLLVAVILCALIIPIVQTVSIEADSVNLYWVGNGGNWSDTSHWSITSGGSGGHAAPTSSNPVYFNANSFSSNSQTVTVNADSCLNMDWTGVTHSPTFDIPYGKTLQVYGSVTFVSGMVSAGDGTLVSNGDPINFATGGLALTFTIEVYAGVFNLIDNLTINNDWISSIINWGTFNTNNHVINASTAFITAYATGITNLGSSSVTCGAWICDGLSTLNAGTSNIIVNYNSFLYAGNFTGGGKTYYAVRLNASSHTITESNTFTSFALNPSTTQTIIFTDGTDQTMSDPVELSGDGNIHTLVGSSTGNWTITKSGGGIVKADYLDIQNSNGSPGTTWYYGSNSTADAYSQANGWAQYSGITPKVTTTSPSTNITDSSVTLAGNLTDTGSEDVTEVGFCYGLFIYPNVSGTKVSSVAGTYSTGAFTSGVSYSIPNITGLGTNITYHYRAYATNSIGTSYGADQTFATLTNVADLYWVGNGGDWTNPAHWSTTSGGSGYGGIPYRTNSVYFNANSFSSGGQTVNIDVNGGSSFGGGECKNMDWTGVTNTPAIRVGYWAVLNIYGTIFTLDPNMTWTAVVDCFVGFYGNTVLTTNGVPFGGMWILPGGSVTMMDDVNCSQAASPIIRTVWIDGGTLTTNNHTLTAPGVGMRINAGNPTLNLGTSIINVTNWEVGGAATLNGTYTINVSGDHFYGGGLTYNNVNITGSALTITDSNTFNILSLPSSTTQSITFTDGSTQTVNTATLSGSVGHIHTLQGSSTGGWNIAKTGGYSIGADYVNLIYSNGSPGDTWYYGTNSTVDTVTGWNEISSPVISSSTAVSIGITTGTGGATVVNDRGSIITERGVCVATTSDPDLTKTVFTAAGTTGVFTVSITGLNSNTTYHLRGYATNSVDISYSDDITFTTLTPPPPPVPAGNQLALAALPIILLMSIIYGALRFVAKSEYSDNRIVVIVLITVIMLVGLAILTAVQGILNGL